MRLGIKLLNVGASLNQHSQVDMIRVARGEGFDLLVQLVDLDQKGLRYVPPAGATLQITLPRATDILRVDASARQTVNYTIDRAASPAWSGEDRSIWKIPLVEADTVNLVSTAIRVVLVEGVIKKIATLNQAIKVMDSQEN